MSFEAIVIGVSSGGMKVLKTLFSSLPSTFQLPIVIVQHISARSDNQWIKMLNDTYDLTILEVEEKEKIENGKIYIAPANYHVLIEKNKSFSLSVEPLVNHARPSVDILFETAADAYKDKLIGIVLTGANSDGAAGLKKIKDLNGLVIVQDPSEAENYSMPNAAIKSAAPEYILPLMNIIDLLIKLDRNTHKTNL